MHALTNSGAVLLAVLLFFLLILFAELSYIFCCRTGSLPSPASKEMEEDVVAAAVPEEEFAAADKWRVSRLLFTIEEEDLELEDDDDDVISAEVDNGFEVQVDIPVEYSGDPTPFLTPCNSPPYFTPSPSPGRDMDDVIDVYEVSSRNCCFNFQGSQMC
ncbi:transmembrane protein [Arabidopsis thaliana]|jgi:hypothetical protein|uniref:Transmembrane protein n=1 Tax=Arabidopsis thaliana TaxID=3702 RepID=A0A1I9LQ90_ARATH|nr:uncharacterized protein AT3G11640 [Arabidopsis thaliana]ANM64748.1 transmembrane protein [Arabidopsis thaliana]|eukprot:NP_001326756.1 transmembrane protein [Arabidopsis thaliana]